MRDIVFDDLHAPDHFTVSFDGGGREPVAKARDILVFLRKIIKDMPPATAKSGLIAWRGIRQLLR
ncbi:MAG: hypothetical protein DI624_06525 [Brevundimonas sp.]|nr:MAG: hypothetical protein DI624_06525 [Brevundimonas sp.]